MRTLFLLTSVCVLFASCSKEHYHLSKIDKTALYENHTLAKAAPPQTEFSYSKEPEKSLPSDQNTDGLKPFTPKEQVKENQTKKAYARVKKLNDSVKAGIKNISDHKTNTASLKATTNERLDFKLLISGFVFMIAGMFVFFTAGPAFWASMFLFIGAVLALLAIILFIGDKISGSEKKPGT